MDGKWTTPTAPSSRSVGKSMGPSGTDFAGALEEPMERERGGETRLAGSRGARWTIPDCEK